jgi:succinate dehydrogenase/fumarate reductase flavoprotein subunit
MKPDEVAKSEVLVIGGGIAGTAAAISARRAGADVTLVDKAVVARSGQSTFAAGIYAIYFPEKDNLDDWVEEMIDLGEYLNDQAWVDLLWEKNYQAAMELDRWGTEYGRQIFERDEKGKFIRRKSRGHIKTFHSIMNSIPMMETLKDKAIDLGVRIIERVMVTDFIRNKDRVIGALGFNPQNGKIYLFQANALIAAASGAGFKSAFMGHKNLTGDVLAAACRIGVAVQNMENVCSNTCARHFDIHGLNLFVNVGGKLTNGQGEEFMWKYRPDLGNRARMQDLTLAFCQEVEMGRGPIFMDLTSTSKGDQALCRKILPETFATFDAAGINLFAQKIEWMPAFMGTLNSGGGIRIGLDCATNLSGLFAAGDITPEPPHGTYSYGGVNIAFSHVSGIIAGERAADFAKREGEAWDNRNTKEDIRDGWERTLAPLKQISGIDSKEVIFHIQSKIIPKEYGYLRNQTTLEEGLSTLRSILKEEIPNLRARDPHELMRCLEARNLAEVGELILKAALYRKESRGWHFRKDFPYSDNKNWLKWVILTRQGEGIKIEEVPVPTPRKSPLTEITVPPGVRRS